jgi:hypothetical protein
MVGRRYGADAPGPHHDRVSGPDFYQRHGTGRAFSSVDHDATIHLRPSHRDPALLEADKGLEVRGGVEVLRKHAVQGSRFETRVLLFQDLGSVLLQVSQYAFQLILRRSADANHSKGTVAFLPS